MAYDYEDDDTEFDKYKKYWAKKAEEEDEPSWYSQKKEEPKKTSWSPTTFVGSNEKSEKEVDDDMLTDDEWYEKYYGKSSKAKKDITPSYLNPYGDENDDWDKYIKNWVNKANTKGNKTNTTWGNYKAIKTIDPITDKEKEEITAEVLEDDPNYKPPVTKWRYLDRIGFKGGTAIYLGSAPGWSYYEKKKIISNLKEIKYTGIKTIFMLSTDADFKKNYGDITFLKNLYNKMGIKTVRFPITDFSTPSTKDIAKVKKLVDSILVRVKQEDVMIHCNAGLGRTGMIMACVYVRLGFTARQAIYKVRKVRPGTVETIAQEDFVFDFEDYLDGKLDTFPKTKENK